MSARRARPPLAWCVAGRPGPAGGAGGWWAGGRGGGAGDWGQGTAGDPLLPARTWRPGGFLGRGNPARPAACAVHAPSPGEPPMTTTPESQTSQATQEGGDSVQVARPARPVRPHAGVASAVGSRLAAMLLGGACVAWTATPLAHKGL